MPLQEFNKIGLKSDYRGTLGNQEKIKADTNRTPGKDEVAQYIKEEVIDKGRWPIQMTQLAEETGYSRQHCANVVSDYFEGVDESTNTDTEPEQETVFVHENGMVNEVTIPIPADVVKESYLRGYLAAAQSSE